MDATQLIRPEAVGEMMFCDFEDYLNHDFSLNFWSDEGISAAVELVAKFSNDDWHLLAKKWRSKPTVWKVRCAETIDSQPLEQAIEILLDMLDDQDSEVVIAAADSLRAMPILEHSVSLPTLKRIAQIRDRSGVAVNAVLTDFLSRART